MQQFKIGDWVKTINNTRIFQVGYIGRDSYYTNDRLKSIKFDKSELWQPKTDEWCWFKTCNSGFELGQFIEQLSADKYRYRLNSTNSLFNCNYCEPFIGELPSFLKGK